MDMRRLFKVSGEITKHNLSVFYSNYKRLGLIVIAASCIQLIAVPDGICVKRECRTIAAGASHNRGPNSVFVRCDLGV